MLAVLQKTVEHRFMLPLIIGATEHETVLYPDTYTGEMEACVNECLSESEPFSIRVEAVSGSAFFEVVSHVLKRCQQELVKFLAFERVVLDRKTIRGFEGYAVGRIGQNKVCILAVHELFHGFISFLAGSRNATVADEDVVVRVNDRRTHKAELPERSPELCNLFFTMRPGIPGIGHQFINRYLF